MYTYKQIVNLSISMAIVSSLCLIPKVAKPTEVSPYIGVDQQLNIIRFKKGYGDNLFKKHHPQGNLYVGVKFDDIFGIELGRTSTRSNDEYSVIRGGECCLGSTVPCELDPVVCKSCAKISAYHLSGIYTYSHDSWEKFRISYGIGTAFLKAEAEREAILIGFPPISGKNRIFQKKKVVLRLMVAPEYKFSNNLGIRSSICFLNTSKVIIRAEPTPGAYTPIIRLKDSFVYSLGVFFEF